MYNQTAFEYINGTLSSPNGTSLLLFQTTDFDNDTYLTILDDQANRSIKGDEGEPPYIGSHIPQINLSGFDGASTNGDWKMIISNSQSFTGTLDWSLLVNSSLSRPTVTIT